MSQQKLRALALWFILSLLAGATTTTMAGCNASQQRRRGNSRRADAKPTTTPQPTPEEPLPDPARGEEKTVSDEIKILSRGNYSNEMLESFVAVSRDAETYAALRALNAQLPGLSADFFKRNAVVAAFLGQRRSGGYGVEITRAGPTSLRISERAPDKDAIVTMALTSPSLIVTIAIAPDAPLELLLDPTWRERARPYQVASGELIITGGIAGKRETVPLAGSFGVMRAGQLATFLFDLKSAGGEQPRALREAATGIVANGGDVVRLPRFTSSTLTGAIESPFRATGGQFTKDGGQITLTFETVTAPRISDNFAATGRLEATATAPAPKNKALTDERSM